MIAPLLSGYSSALSQTFQQHLGLTLVEACVAKSGPLGDELASSNRSRDEEVSKRRRGDLDTMKDGDALADTGEACLTASGPLGVELAPSSGQRYGGSRR